MTPEERANKRGVVYLQMREAKHRLNGMPITITCGCGRCIPIRFMYKCLYCGEWYCRPCAEAHFGKNGNTREIK